MDEIGRKKIPILLISPATLEFFHDGDKHFQCDICDVQYPLKSSLQQQIESVHAQNLNSEVHENIETKSEDIEITIGNIEYRKKEYTCRICNKLSKGRQTLVNMRKNHKGKNVILDVKK